MFFFNEILENKEIKQLLLNDDNLMTKGQEIAEKIIESGQIIYPEVGLLPLAVLNFLADYCLEKNNNRGIPKEITVSSLKDVNLWIENYKTQYGSLGFEEFGWMIGFYTGERFRLGRLQYNFGAINEYIPSGDSVLEVHIPQGEPLSTKACLDSFQQAKEFFAKFYPNKKPEYFLCDSWLLCPELEHIAEENSNLVQFMKLWIQIPFPSDNSAQAIERVFGFGFQQENLKNAPEKTHLQRNLKSYLLNGGQINMAAGFRKI